MKSIKITTTVLLLFSLVAMGCQSPVQSSTNGASPTGTLTLSIPPLASGIADAANPSTKASQSVARVYAYASSAAVQVYNSSNTLLSTSTIYMINGTGTVSSVPAGTNYTVKVSLYNSNVSTTVPTVTGTVTGVTVNAGVTANVAVTCTPYLPASLTGNDTPYLLAKTEKYYSLAVTSGQTYYFDQTNTSTNTSVLLGLFDASGNSLVNWNGLRYSYWTATYTGTAYLGLANDSSTTSAAMTVVTSQGPATPDGSITTPWVTYAGYWNYYSFGASAASYYQFTTTVPGTYEFNLGSATSFTANLYTASTFTGLIAAQTVANGVLTFTGLAASTTYYVSVLNNTASAFITYGPFLPVLPVTGTTWTAGSITTASAPAWYVATVNPGQTYSLYWDDGYAPRSGTYSLDVDVSAFQPNMTPYFTNIDAGYATPKSITIPAGQTKLYIKVRAWNGGTGTGTFGLKLQ